MRGDDQLEALVHRCVERSLAKFTGSLRDVLSEMNIRLKEVEGSLTDIHATLGSISESDLIREESLHELVKQVDTRVWDMAKDIQVMKDRAEIAEAQSKLQPQSATTITTSTTTTTPEKSSAPLPLASLEVVSAAAAPAAAPRVVPPEPTPIEKPTFSETSSSSPAAPVIITAPPAPSTTIPVVAAAVAVRPGAPPAPQVVVPPPPPPPQQQYHRQQPLQSQSYLATAEQYYPTLSSPLAGSRPSPGLNSSGTSPAPGLMDTGTSSSAYVPVAGVNLAATASSLSPPPPHQSSRGPVGQGHPYQGGGSGAYQHQGYQHQHQHQGVVPGAPPMTYGGLRPTAAGPVGHTTPPQDRVAAMMQQYGQVGSGGGAGGGTSHVHGHSSTASSGRMTIDRLVEEIAAMGFPPYKVRETIQDMAAQGGPMDVNEIVEKLTR